MPRLNDHQLMIGLAKVVSDLQGQDVYVSTAVVGVGVYPLTHSVASIDPVSQTAGMKPAVGARIYSGQTPLSVGIDRNDLNMRNGAFVMNDQYYDIALGPRAQTIFIVASQTQSCHITWLIGA